jgi:uncharacterized protein (TIGR02246 family)
MIRAPLSLLAVLVAGSAQAQAPDSNAEIRAVAQAFDDAQVHGDGAALDRLLAPDFLFVRGSGRVGDRKDFIEAFANAKAKLEPFVISDRLFLRVSPDVAVVGGEAWVEGVEDGKPLAQHFRYSDTLAKRDGRWLIVYAQVTGLPAKPAK